MKVLQGIMTRFSWNFFGFGLAQLAYIEAYKLLLTLPEAPHLTLDTYWLAAALAAGLVGLVGCKAVAVARVRSFSIVTAIVASALGLVLLFAAPSLGLFAMVPSACLLGAGCSLLWVAWFDRLARLNGTTIFFYVAICALVMALFHVASTMFPAVQQALMVCSLGGSFVLLLSDFGKGDWSGDANLEAATGVTLGEPCLSARSVILTICVFVFSYHFAIRTVFLGTTDFIKDSEDIVSACIMLVVFFIAKRCNFVSVLRVALPLIVLLYILIGVLPPEVRSAGILAAGSASKLIQLFLMVELAYLASKNPPGMRWVVVSLGTAAMFFGRLLGDFCYQLLVAAAPAEMLNSLVLYVLLASLLCTLLVLLTSKTHDGSQEAGEQTLPETSAPEASLLQELAVEYGLTVRETEVLELLAQGRTRAVIAKKLYITEGTTHAHMSHIYNKMGVHSQQELLDIIEGKASSEA